MAKDLDSRSRSILTFRPNIDFVEPAQVPQQPNPVEKPVVVDDDASEAERIRQELYNLAASIEVLATAVQARIDVAAKDIRIKLDPKVDIDAIAALKRLFPDIPFTTKATDSGPESDGFFIDYGMYKKCRDDLRKFADEQAAKNHITKEQIDEARALLPTAIVGGFGSPAAKNGTLRPELNIKAQLIEPIDIEKFQDYLIRMLVNFCWKTFVLPPFKTLPIVGSLLPEELCTIPESFKKQLSDAKDKGVNTL